MPLKFDTSAEEGTASEFNISHSSEFTRTTCEKIYTDPVNRS